jgi:ribosomal protein S18 acetylase RimI-like enzyme
MLAACAIDVDELRAEDVCEAASLGARVFAVSPFYRHVLGFDLSRFGIYWRHFLELTLEDDGASALVLRDRAHIVGLAVIGREGFPSRRLGGRFLVRLAREVGGRTALHYVRFVAAYERVMAAPRNERDRTVRAYWILVSPEARGTGRGAGFVRRVLRYAVGFEGRIVTALVDGSDDRLIALYRRLGFGIDRSFRIAGCPAVRIIRHPSSTGRRS